MRWLNLASKSAEVLSVSLAALLLTGGTEFALRCHVEQHKMSALVTLAQHRQRACTELGWRWDADDQEHQYGPGNSAGTDETVGPIAGFVMDVTENEYGHAEGQCHAVNAPYRDLLTRY